MTTEHIAPGAPVKFGPHSGHVLRVQVMIGCLLYQVGYWTSDQKFEEIWLDAFLVTEAEGERLPMGFRLVPPPPATP
jgi:hypothetical protein